MSASFRAVLLFALCSACTPAVAPSLTMQCPGDRKDFLVDNVEPHYLAKWTALFDESERLERTEEGRGYNPLMLRAHNSFYPEVGAKCFAEAQQTNEQLFLAIAIVSKTGEIQQYLTMPPHPEYACYANNMVGHRYPPPPKDGYPVGFLQVLTEKPDTSTTGECLRHLNERIRAQDAHS